MTLTRTRFNLVSLVLLSVPFLGGCEFKPNDSSRPVIASKDMSQVRQELMAGLEAELETLRTSYAKVNGEFTALKDKYGTLDQDYSKLKKRAEIDQSLLSDLRVEEARKSGEIERYRIRQENLEAQREDFYHRFSKCQEALIANGFDIELVLKGIKNKDGTLNPTEYEVLQAKYRQANSETELLRADLQEKISSLKLLNQNLNKTLESYKLYVPADVRKK